MLAGARRFFADREVLEIDTPILSASAVSDPNIESIRALLRLDDGRYRYLHTSPEYHMKRLLAAGYPDIYSIGKVFRDGEAGKRHQPEFTLVEWYRLGFGLRDMIAETCDFIGNQIDGQRLSAPVESLSFTQAFVTFTGLDPLRADCTCLANAADADPRLRDSIGDDRDQWLDLLISRRIAPALARDRLTVLHHYPASQAALARICPDNATLADRFEVFFGDIELANGYVELRDANVQSRRWEHDLLLRQQRRQALVPPDDKLIASLHSGLPACAGVAVGFDRLLMVNEQCDDIGRVQTFAFERMDAT
jgi:lysyl-tRNA synthetase class 2